MDNPVNEGPRPPAVWPEVWGEAVREVIPMAETLRRALAAARRWGVEPDQIIEGRCGIVITDGQRAVKADPDPSRARANISGMRALVASGVIVEILDQDEDGTALMPYVEGSHVDVIDRIDDIAAAVDAVRTCGANGLPSHSWPTLEPGVEEASILELRELSADVRQAIGDLGQLVPVHGDLWSDNILSVPHQPLVLIDANPRLGYVACEAADLAVRTLAYDRPGDGSVFEVVADAFGLPVETILWLSLIKAGANVANNIACGRPERAAKSQPVQDSAAKLLGRN